MITAPTELPLPGFFDPSHAEQWDYSPDQQRLFEEAQEWRRRHGIRAAAEDARRVALLLIDLQKDFCFPRGSLYVGGRSGRGALDDNRRIAAFIYRNLGRITSITATMDTHFAYQIFFPSFWVGADGAALAPHREVTADQIERGEVRPNVALAQWLTGGDTDALLRQAVHYCRELERSGKYRLYLWPPHCILGSEGHALAGVVHEARMFHAFARAAQSTVEAKGGNPLTENYSALRPEVLTRYDGGALASPNEALVDALLAADVLYVAGQAASHCVKSTLEDLLAAIQARDPRLARKVYVLTDCMSSVAVPDGRGGFLADFTADAEAALRRFEAAGMNLVRAEAPIDG